MLDEIFAADAPDWVHLLFEHQDKEITKQLKAESVLYVEKSRRIKELYEKYPLFMKIMESEDLSNDVILNKQDVKCLSELIALHMDIMGMYQKMYFYRGFMMAIKSNSMYTNDNKENEEDEYI